MSTLLKQGLSIDAHMEERKQQCDKVFQLCHDYQLHSPNLDGSVLEILQKVQQVLDLDSKFLVEHRNRDVSGIEELQKDVAEIRKVLEEQIKEGY